MAVTSADDRETLLKIFPNEVWEMILGEVTDAPNYHRISNASPHFRSLLLSRAPQILFPEVANCLVERYAGVKSLPLRQVCRDWRKGVDQRLQTQDFSEDKHELLGYCNLATLAVFIEEGNFTNFEKHFDPTHHLADQVNPFLSRGVHVIIDEENLGALEPFFASLNRMLGKYGHHIWYLAIQMDDINDLEVLVDFCKRRLPAILQLLPNIRVLVILCEDLDELLQPELDRDNVEQMSFPNLHQLHSLDLSEMPPSVARELVAKNPQVHRAEAGYTPGIISTYVELLPNLKEIRCTCLQPDDFETFRSTRITGGVEALWLDMFDGEVSWEQIFPALKSLDSVTELRLCLPGFQGDPKNIPELILPGIKRLTLAWKQNAVPLDFLLPMKNTLEYLCLQLWLNMGTNTSKAIKEAGELEEEGGVKLFECWRELEVSNVWSIFPKLKILKTVVYKIGADNTEVLEECQSCIRDDWKKAQSGKQ